MPGEKGWKVAALSHGNSIKALVDVAKSTIWMSKEMADEMDSDPFVAEILAAFVARQCPDPEKDWTVNIIRTDAFKRIVERGTWNTDKPHDVIAYS